MPSIFSLSGRVMPIFTIATGMFALTALRTNRNAEYTSSDDPTTKTPELSITYFRVIAANKCWYASSYMCHCGLRILFGNAVSEEDHVWFNHTMFAARA
jgi:hypothetical protein